MGTESRYRHCTQGVGMQLRLTDAAPIRCSLYFFALGLICAGAARGVPNATDTIAAPRDVAWPGTIMLAVDATDVDRRILKVEQVLPVQRPGPLTLHYPRWLPGTHGPWEDVNELTGLQIQAGARTVDWIRR
jgi:hypothetical protein